MKLMVHVVNKTRGYHKALHTVISCEGHTTNEVRVSVQETIGKIR
jgi:hypothetical protein